MTELLTMIALAANVIPASVLMKFVRARAGGSAAGERADDADTFDGRVLVRIPVRNVRR